MRNEFVGIVNSVFKRGHFFRNFIKFNNMEGPGPVRYFLIILCISFCLLGWLAVHTYYINAWPSDSAASYIPTARTPL